MTRPERLLSELHAYAPAADAQQRHRGRMVNLLTGSADPFIRKLRERSLH